MILSSYKSSDPHVSEIRTRVYHTESSENSELHGRFASKLTDGVDIKESTEWPRLFAEKEGFIFAI